MMNRPPPTISKWIFVAADLLMLAVFAWLVRYFLPPKTTWDYVIILTLSTLWAYGAYICITPWLVEFKAHTRHLENETLADAMDQLKRLEDVGARVQSATASWQAAHDSAARVTAVAREIEDKIRVDMKDFTEFAERVNNEEKNHLKLEVEKLRRTEGDWLQVTARLLDHTFALHQAALRSGQPNVITQTTNFQNACRDSIRRMGLAVFQPAPGDPFDARGHQTDKPDAEVPAGALIAEVFATGFTYQGQLLRRALVRVAMPEAAPAEIAPTEETAPAPSNENITHEEPATEIAEAHEEPAHAPEEPASIAPTLEEPAAAPAPIPDPPQPQDSAPAETAPVNGQETQSASEAFTLVSPAEPEPEPTPRRRARKPDPQATLPF